ncbi:hypothetical protein [Tabrizicola sp. BL-A-41-H6]|uniref:hypothetical protein n=1 Tax=Tabrizicola sp. BL-A-41-H6 TaxID=3421107 RepID=UPI003D66614B
MRDFDRKGEPNKENTNRIIFAFLSTFKRKDLFKEDLTPEKILGDAKLETTILWPLIGEIAEYGRMVHGEMSAITDAAAPRAQCSGGGFSQ